MDVKNILQSKTFWINLVIMILTWILQNQGVLTQVGISSATITMIVTVANIVLRLISNQGVSLTAWKRS